MLKRLFAVGAAAAAVMGAGVTVAVMLATASAAWRDVDPNVVDYWSRADYAGALRYLRPLAEQGDARAQLNLGIQYVNGLGVPQDYVEAAKWLRLAAEQGTAEAQKGLGSLYDMGKGVPQDYVLAYMWFNLAVAQPGMPRLFSQDASEGRDRVATKMTPDQIAEAQRLSREWRPAAER